MPRSGIQLCYPFEESRLAKWSPPYIVQPKLDGERCRVIGNFDTGWHLLSSEENWITSVPHIQSALHAQLEQPGLELDGELYTHGMDFNEIHSRVGRTVNLHPDHEAIQYHVFDIVNEDPQYSRLTTLKGLNLKPPLHIVSIYVCETFDEVMRAYDSILAQGYEGIIVRHIDSVYVRKRSTFMMKFKPKKDDYYEITGWEEETSIDGVPKGTLGSLECRGQGGHIFNVGSGFTKDQREAYWNIKNDLIGKLCHVQYQNITSGKGIPRFPIYIEIIEGDPML